MRIIYYLLILYVYMFCRPILVVQQFNKLSTLDLCFFFFEWFLVPSHKFPTIIIMSTCWTLFSIDYYCSFVAYFGCNLVLQKTITINACLFFFKVAFNIMTKD
jgi:hypothetical protein